MDNADIERALARLEGRRDPAPTELPPPVPEETRTLRLDLRLQGTEIRRGDEIRLEGRVLGPDGSERPAHDLATIMIAVARIIALSSGWSQPIWRAARGVVVAAHECARMSPPRPRS